jgi:hypothetical protein
VNGSGIKGRLTVRTSVHLQPESDPPAGVPVGRPQADVVSHHRVLQLVLDHAVCVTVPGEGLQGNRSGLTACRGTALGFTAWRGTALGLQPGGVQLWGLQPGGVQLWV